MGAPDRLPEDDGARPLTLRLSLLGWVAAALTPILIIAGLQAYSDARDAVVDRRNDLLVIADRAVDRVEGRLSSAEALLTAFDLEIANGECREVWERLRGDFPILTNVARIEADGLISCTAVGEPGSQIQVPEWLDILKSGQRTLRTEAVYGEKSLEWVYAILTRIDDQAGNFDGAVAVGIDARALLGLFMEDPFLPDGVQVALADPTGRIFGSETFRQFGTEQITDALSGGAAELLTVTTDSSGALDVVVKSLGPEGVFALVARPSPGLMSESSLDPVTAFGLPFLTFAAALAAAWLAIDNLVLRWLTRLRRLTVRYAAGQYDYETDGTFDRAPWEVKRLSSTLTQMARRISNRDKDLKQAIAVRDDAVREIHHRVKNNLQIVTSFLNLQSRQLQDDAARDALRAARHRIDALSIVHQTLYQHERLEMVRMKPFLTSLLTHLREAMGMGDADVELKWELADVERKSDDAIPFALFLLEAVTNCMKYAFDPDKGGNIRVALEEESGAHVLIVEDDGEGLGDEKSSGDGLGSRLMTAFARQLGGSYSVEQIESGGVRVTLTSPAE